jgi:hypothetical protein
MPNFDGGHYFLTALLPIRNDTLVREDLTLTSPVHLVRQALAVLPKAQQSPSTVATGTNYGLNSPFARSPRTHFARFAVINDAIFNGRDPMDPILGRLQGVNPTLGKSCDQLRCPYLLFVADFDATSGDESELRSYLDELWTVMKPELRSVLSQCYRFDTVTTKDDFSRLIIAGQIETTMPFNDYWIDTPEFQTYPSASARSQLVNIGKAAVAAVVIDIGLVLLWLVLTFINILADSTALTTVNGWIGFSAATLFVLSLLLIALLAFLVWRAYRGIVSHSATAFPAGIPCDLKSILKALYLQQRFQEFASAAQSIRDPATLHRVFGQFLAQHRPSDVNVPTQPPGVIRS